MPITPEEAAARSPDMSEIAPLFSAFDAARREMIEAERSLTKAQEDKARAEAALANAQTRFTNAQAASAQATANVVNYVEATFLT